MSEEHSASAQSKQSDAALPEKKNKANHPQFFSYMKLRLGQSNDLYDQLFNKHKNKEQYYINKPLYIIKICLKR